MLPALLLTLYLLLGVYLWITLYGFRWPENFWMIMLAPQNVILAIIFTMVSLTSIALSILKMSYEGVISVFAWSIYLPVIWNITVPMFISFMTVVGLIYIPILPIALNPIGYLMVNGIIISFEPYKTILTNISYILMAIGLTIYFASLYKLLISKIKGIDLVINGLYSINRHPQYLGIILWTLGVAIIGWRPIGYLSWETLTYTYLILAEIEETKLHKKHGKKYYVYYGKVMGLTPLNRIIKGRKHRLIAYTAFYITIICITIMWALKAAYPIKGF